MEKELLNQEIEKGAFNKGGEASSKLKDLLRKLGVKPQVIRKASIVTYEMEMNIIIHSEGGTINATVNPEGITVTAEDEGPGIANLERAMEPGFSTASDEVRELGFGAGMGLNNIKSYSDEFEIDSELDTGTTVCSLIKL